MVGFLLVMSIDAMAWAKAQLTGSPGAKLVLLVLADYADDTGLSWPSKALLAKITEQDPRTIQRHLRHLERLQLVTVDVRSRKDGGRSSNSYRLPLDKMSPPQRQNLQGGETKT